MLRRLAISLVALTSLVACGDDATDGTTTTTTGAGGSGSSTTATSGTAGAGGGPLVHVRLRASTSPVAHMDGLAGETPIAHSSGIRSLKLYKTASDPSPLTVFDFGQDSVEAGYNDGDDTEVAAVVAKTLPKEAYTVARVVHSYVRYEVAATGHSGGLSAPGMFDNMQVLSDGSLVDGMLRDHGYFEYKFITSGVTFPLTGTNAPEPEWSGGGGFSVTFENGEYAYYFPIALSIEPAVPFDVNVVLSVNMHESFRWQDENMPGYATGVFDTTSTVSEPVQRFGANTFDLHIE